MLMVPMSGCYQHLVLCALPWQLLFLSASWKAAWGERTYLITHTSQNTTETRTTAENRFISQKHVLCDWRLCWATGVKWFLTLWNNKTQSKVLIVYSRELVEVGTGHVQVITCTATVKRKEINKNKKGVRRNFLLFSMNRLYVSPSASPSGGAMKQF